MTRPRIGGASAADGRKRLPGRRGFDRSPPAPEDGDFRLVPTGMRWATSVEQVAMPTLFTIGYENHRTPESLIAALREAGVQRLVDVRELPLSRKRGFSKTSLAAALEDADIEYEHVRALGNPKPYRDLYKAGRIAEGERYYRKHLQNGSYSALVELGETLELETCLLCFEAKHEECHRSIIVEALEERLGEINVVHLQ